MARVNKTSNKRSYGDQPSGYMKRNMFPAAKQFVATGQMGRLIPFYHAETLPGDIWNLRAEVMLRFLPMYFPIMHQIELSMHWFYVPRRILNPTFEDFINPATPDTEWAHCRLDQGGIYNGIATNTLETDSVFCYMGIPVSSGAVQDTISVDAHFVASYAKIYDDYYRFNPIQSELFQPLAEGANSWVNDIGFERPLFSAWNHDYFTSGLPEAQSGEDVLVPLFDSDQNVVQMRWGKESSGGVPDPGATATTGRQLQDSNGDAIGLVPEDINGEGASMQEFRLAARLLEFLEKSNRAGENYRDYIITTYGFDPMPGVVDEPQYIGGTRGQVMVSDVMSTSQTLESDNSVSSVVGDYTGQALALQSSRSFKYYCKEWGDIVGIMRVRPRSSYYQGLHRKFTRSTPLDYAQAEFAHLGDQPILNQEIYLDYSGTNTNDEVFAYTPRYEEYRGDNDTVAGKMRDDFEAFHLARKFAATPSFNESFIQCQPDVARVFNGVTESSTEHEMFINVLNDNTVYRNLPRFGIPKL